MAKNVLEEAKEIIYGDREKTYGHPSKNLLAIATMWDTYLVSRGLFSPDQDTLRPEDVAVMMVLLKMARLANDPSHRDSIVDGIGYLALIERIKEAALVERCKEGVE